MHVFLKLKAGNHLNWPSFKKKKRDTPQEKLLLSATTVFLTKAGVHQKPAEDFFPMTDSTKGGRSSSPPVGMALRFLWEKIKTKLLQQTLRCRERWVTWRFFSFRFAIKDRWFLDVWASAFSNENSQGWIMVRLVEDPLNNYCTIIRVANATLHWWSFTRCDMAFRWKTGIRRCQKLNSWKLMSWLPWLKDFPYKSQKFSSLYTRIDQPNFNPELVSPVVPCLSLPGAIAPEALERRHQ